MLLAIPTGSPNSRKNNSLDQSEANGFLNEIQRAAKRSVSPSSRADPPGPESETAAQAGPLNGGNQSEKHTRASTEISYHGNENAATRAAVWYAENRSSCPRPVVRSLRGMFGVSTREAIQAIQFANGGVL